MSYPGDVTITFEDYLQFGSAATGFTNGSPQVKAHSQSQTFPIDTAVKRTGSASMKYISWSKDEGGYDPTTTTKLRVYQSPLQVGQEGRGMFRDPPGQEVWWAWSLRFPDKGTYMWTIPPDFSSWHVTHTNYWGPMSFETTGGGAALKMEFGGGRIVSPAEHDSGLYGDWGGIAAASGEGVIGIKTNDPERRANGFHGWETLLGEGGVRPLTKNVWHDFIMHARWNGYTNGILEIQHREESGSWALLYSNVQGADALIQRAPHPTCVWNTQHGEQGEAGRQYDPERTAVNLSLQMYRSPTHPEAGITWGLWMDNLLRRSSESQVKAYLPASSAQTVNQTFRVSDLQGNSTPITVQLQR